MESCVNNSSPPIKEILNQKHNTNTKHKHNLESSPQRFSHTYNKQSKSNPNQSEKYPKNTEVHQKEVDNCHSARRF